jgi:beta-phosphoglucomutase
MAEARYAVLWDMDGTLVDTAELHFRAWKDCCHELGRDFTPADFSATFGRRNPEIFKILFGDKFRPDEVALYSERKEEAYRKEARVVGVKLLPGVRALVEGLHAAGFGQAIGSSAPHGNLDLILELTGIAPYLGAVVGMEDTQRGKPDPQVFLVGAERLKTPPSHCLVMEDAPAGIEAGKAGGMKCVGVRFAAHHPVEALLNSGADLVVETLEEVSVDVVRRLLGVSRS